MGKNILTIRLLHIISIIAVVCVIFIGAFAYIDNDTAYINIFDIQTREIGRCVYRENFGIECPSCGLTRSFICIEDFNIGRSLDYNRVGILVYLIFFLLLIYNILSLFKAKYAWIFGRVLAIYSISVAVLLFGSWILKFFFGI
jgi:hypothetical protein